MLPMTGATLLFGWKFHAAPADVLPLHSDSYRDILERFARVERISGDGLTDLIAFDTLMTVAWIMREGRRLAQENAEFI